MKNKFFSQKGIAPIAIIIILALVVLGIIVYRSSIGKGPITQILQGPSQTAPMILSAVTTKSIDPKTGAPGTPVTVFSPKDPVIYLVLNVNKPPKSTKFEYVRYYNGKYVDHNSLETTKDKVDFVSFSWKLKNSSSTHLIGTYKVKLYTNGHFEKEVTYEVR